VLKYIFLFFLIISLDAYDLNISYSYFLEDKIKSDKELFLLQKAIDETSKSAYDKLVEEVYSYDEVYAMNKYFKKVKQDKSCKVTYSYKNRHFFNFTCKDKKRDKVYIFTKNYISVAIGTNNVRYLEVYNMTIVDMNIKDMDCWEVCGLGRNVMMCILKPSDNKVGFKQ